MKALFISILFSMLFNLATRSQTTSYIDQTANTWYVIAPTSGCNGIWAIDITNWPCGMGCSYAMANPIGCLTSYFPNCDSIVADTLFLKLCSVPCNLAATCDTISEICGTGTPVTTTGISSLNQPSGIKLFPNPSEGELTLQYDTLSSAPGMLRIYDITGRLVGSISVPEGTGSMRISTSQLQRGIYQCELIVGQRIAHTEKLIITGESQPR